MSVENLGDELIDEVLNGLGHSLPLFTGQPEQLVLKRTVQFFEVAPFQAFLFRVCGHLVPHGLRQTLIGDFREVSVLVQYGIAVFIDFKTPRNHLERGGHICFGGVSLTSDSAQPFETVAGSAVLSARYAVFLQGRVDFRGQVDLNARVAGLNPMSGTVVQRNPVREDAVARSSPESETGPLRR